LSEAKLSNICGRSGNRARRVRIIRAAVAGDANETRDWRIYAALAQTLIVQARKLYAGEDLGLDLKNTVYALDSTTIDLCLLVFPTFYKFRLTPEIIR
jgi:hypothetical protein